MKKTSSMPPLSERTRLIIASSLTGAMLLLAMLLPLAFRRGVPAQTEPDGMPLEQRAVLFAAYWAGEDERAKPQTESISDPGSDTVGRCEARMRGLVEEFVPDEGLDYSAPTGSDYTRLRTAEGSVDVCRMWLEAQGDWQNWMDVCFDAETGDLYYPYVSRSCLRNADRYLDDEPLTARQVAETLSGELGGVLRRYEPTEGGGLAIVSADGGAVCYSIGCVSYDRLVDVKVQAS